MEDKPMFNWMNELFSSKKSPSADIDTPDIDDIDPVKTAMSSSEFIKQLEAGERRFSNLMVEGVDLRGLDLSHLVLANCELQDSDLSYACL
ncbi:pentapeptide repeat-containing protein, partial [Arthrospira platensis SPKY1]|nr:pentapeptide repeat-containing protein [Arthrospira platensis SPKY1]